MYSISPSHPRIKQGTYLNNLKSCTSPQTMLVLSVLELCLIFKSWATYYLSMFFLIVNAYLNVLIVWHIAQHFFQHLLRFTFFLSVSDKYFQCLDGKKNVLLNPHSWIMIYQDTKFSKYQSFSLNTLRIIFTCILVSLLLLKKIFYESNYCYFMACCLSGWL